MVLVITLIFTMHNARGCAPPPNLKNSMISKTSQILSITDKGKIILPFDRIKDIYIK